MSALNFSGNLSEDRGFDRSFFAPTGLNANMAGPDIKCPELFLRDMLPVVREAGLYMAAAQPGIRLNTKYSASGNLLAMAITEADIKSQEIILEGMLKLGYRPGIYAEEQSRYLEHFTEQGITRVTLDPIDGTLAYARQYPCYGPVIAVYQSGVLAAAMVHMPAYGKFYCASMEQAAAWVVEYDEASQTFRSQAYELEPHNSCEVLVYKFTDEQSAALKEHGFHVHHLGEEGDEGVGTKSIFTGEIAAFMRPRAGCLDWTPIALIVEKAGGTASDLDGSKHDLYRHWDGNFGGEPWKRQGILASQCGRLHARVLGALARSPRA